MNNGRIWKGCAAGIAGGLAATVVMTSFQSAWTAVKKRTNNGTTLKNNARSRSISQQLAEIRYADSAINDLQKASSNESPTAKVADKAVSLAGQQLSPSGKKTGGTVVHYAFGTLMGGLYGATLEYAPRWYRRNAVGSGLLMGSALFAAADEIALPAMKLAHKPSQVPVATHVYGLASHLVYGAAAGLLTRAFRNAL